VTDDSGVVSTDASSGGISRFKSAKESNLPPELQFARTYLKSNSSIHLAAVTLAMPAILATSFIGLNGMASPP
jgi:hypothetical protein